MPTNLAARRLRLLVVAVAAVLLTLASVLVAPPVNALVLDRDWIGGKDQYATSAMQSQRMGSARVLYLVSGEAGGDALAAAPAARAEGAHILLVRRDSIPEVIANEIRRLNPRWVHVVGSRAVLSDRLWAAVRAILPSASIYRQGSNSGDRVDSALDLMDQIRHANGAVREVFIIGRNGYSDGLAAGNVAARMGAAVIPAIGDAHSWRERITPHLAGVQRIHFVGSSSVLSSSYMDSMERWATDHRVAMDTIAGPDRYATNALLIGRFASSIAGDRAYLVAGNSHGDTIGASVLAAEQGTVMMLSGRYCHDHAAVPSQLERLGANRITGIGTKFWITADALRLTLCGTEPDSPMIVETQNPLPQALYGRPFTAVITLSNPAAFGIVEPVELVIPDTFSDVVVAYRGQTLALQSSSYAHPLSLWLPAGSTSQLTISARVATGETGLHTSVLNTATGQYSWGISIKSGTLERVMLPGTAAHGEPVETAIRWTNTTSSTATWDFQFIVPAELAEARVRVDDGPWLPVDQTVRVAVGMDETRQLTISGIAAGPASGGEYAVLMHTGFVHPDFMTRLPITVLPAAE